MPDSSTSHFLIAYDIANPKRLIRVHRCLKSYGLPVQYSVFTAELRRKLLEQLLMNIAGIIDHCQDDVRCYTLPNRLEFEVLGQQFFPEGVMLFSDLGVNRLLSGSG